MPRKSERRQKELPAVTITRVDSRGRGRGVHVRSDGSERSVAVAGAVPGDVVDVRVHRRKAGMYVGEVHRFITTGIPRRTPFCRHFSECGGCTIQDLEYAHQLTLKEAILRAAFAEVGVSRESLFRPIVPAPRERQYRNKLEFSFGAQRWLTEEEVRHGGEIVDRRGFGFHAPGRFDRVLEITECYLQPDPSESIRAFLGSFARERGLTFYDARQHTGMMRIVVVRTALSGDVMVTMMFGEDDPAVHRQVMDALSQRFPEITSLNYVVNTGANDSLFGHQVHLQRGTPWITERCGDNALRIRPKAFYQTNPEQAVRLYRLALEQVFREGCHPRLVFDLYSGIGSIALFLASYVDRVIGIESVEDAVIAARENAELNGITNAAFVHGEVERELSNAIKEYGPPDLVMIDPPRAGLHPAARSALRESVPERIVYISCNARTQAHDIAELLDLYELLQVQPVDMFPQTRHIETIATLQRKDRPRESGLREAPS